jgi:hypothetical protein
MLALLESSASSDLTKSSRSVRRDLFLTAVMIFGAQYSCLHVGEKIRN